MVNEMIENYKQMWINIFNYNGRENRRKFWLTVLANIIVSIGVSIISGIIRFPGLISLYSVASSLACISLAVRRLHDVNMTGWYLLLGLIPLIGWILVLIALCKDTNN